jgi:hypothetical protein
MRTARQFNEETVRMHGEYAKVRAMVITLVSSAAAASASEPAWADIVGTVAESVTAFVAVAGGIFAYFKFARGRVFKPRCLLSLTSSALRVGAASALRVDVVIKNDGQSALLFDARYTQRLDVFAATHAVWDDAVASGDGVLLWYDGAAPSRSLEIIADPGLFTYAIPVYKDGEEPALEAPLGANLEAGEELRRSVLVPVEPARGYLLQLTIQACSHVGRWSKISHRRCAKGKHLPWRWQARAIICPGDDS